jgi:hypothetical protein
MYPYLINTDNAAMESSSHDFKIKAVHAKTILALCEIEWVIEF